MHAKSWAISRTERTNSSSEADVKAVIDIGSNSVRLMLCEGGSVTKDVLTTRLSENIFFTGELSEAAMHRTVDAVEAFTKRARKLGVTPYLFATEAVRSGKNREIFLQMVASRTGLSVDVLDGQEEALCGFLGATRERHGSSFCATLDIGGASSELAVGKDRPEYAVSIPVGAVKLLDSCGRDRDLLNKLIATALPGYGRVPHFDTLIAIGGTATTLAAYDLKLEPYDPARVHGHNISLERMQEITEELFSLSFEQLRLTPGIPPKRAEVISGGALLLRSIMEYLGVSSVCVSESDNLEGYLLLRQLQGDDLNGNTNA